MRIIVIGFGVIGQNFTKLLLSKSVDLYNQYGMKPRIVACVDSKGSVINQSGIDLKKLLDIKKNRQTVGEYNRHQSQQDVLQIIESVDAEVVLELTPTNLENGEPGLSHIITAMKSGKNVITVNKGPLSVAFPSLIELAKFNGIFFRFSGTVGGGTPILEFAKRCLKGDRIVSFRGILNGTTNYILSKMESRLSFTEALKDAQIRGYAETAPALDIEGLDAAAKLVIMSNWLMDMKVTLEDVERIGISKVTTNDVIDSEKRGNSIKLIASCENKNLIVKPLEVSKLDPICVNGTLNAVTFSLEYSGEQTIIGRGAGGIETASAVLRDMIEIRENIVTV